MENELEKKKGYLLLLKKMASELKLSSLKKPFRPIIV